MSGQTRSVKVWDGWVRALHWTLPVLLGLSWWTAETGRMETHMRSGYAILTLVLFRVAWGLVGSDTARFTRFLRSPIEGLRHLRHLGRREPDTELGHNAAGGWMVLLLLGLLLVQTGTGLFANDQVLAYGPLARRVAGETSDWLSGVHATVFTLILGATALHVVVVLIYLGLKRQNLITPMVTGVKVLPAAPTAVPRLGSPALAAGLLLVAAAAVWGVSRLG